MAKPIKETPILRGKDAKNFVKQINAKKDHHALKEAKERILKNYNHFRTAEQHDRHIAR